MPSPSAGLRICSWNIHLGLQLPAILETVRSSLDFQGIDLLLLQEASARQHEHDSLAIAAALGPTYRAEQRNVDRFHGRTRGLGLVWNSGTFQLESLESLKLPHLDHPSMRRHRYWLNPLRLRPREVLRAEGRAGNLTVRLYVIHLSPVGFTFQTEQLATILRDARHRPECDLQILAGDFNSLRMDRRKWLQWFAAREREGYVNATGDIGWTFRSPALPLRQKLDNMLVKAVGSVRSQCPVIGGSDHLPVFLHLDGLSQKSDCSGDTSLTS